MTERSDIQSRRNKTMALMERERLTPDFDPDDLDRLGSKARLKAKPDAFRLPAPPKARRPKTRRTPSRRPSHGRG